MEVNPNGESESSTTVQTNARRTQDGRTRSLTNVKRPQTIPTIGRIFSLSRKLKTTGNASPANIKPIELQVTAFAERICSGKQLHQTTFSPCVHVSRHELFPFRLSHNHRIEPPIAGPPRINPSAERSPKFTRATLQ